MPPRIDELLLDILGRAHGEDGERHLGQLLAMTGKKTPAFADEAEI